MKTVTSCVNFFFLMGMFGFLSMGRKETVGYFLRVIQRKLSGGPVGASERAEHGSARDYAVAQGQNLKRKQNLGIRIQRSWIWIGIL
jgi:hypothetical protein